MSRVCPPGKAEWQCPYCERAFWIKAGSSPEMCPDCRATAEARRAAAVIPEEPQFEDDGPELPPFRPEMAGSSGQRSLVTTPLKIGVCILGALVVYSLTNLEFRSGEMDQRITPVATPKYTRATRPVDAKTVVIERPRFPSPGVVANASIAEIDELLGTPRHIEQCSDGSQIRSFSNGPIYILLHYGRTGKASCSFIFDTKKPSDDNEALSWVGIDSEEVTRFFHGPSGNGANRYRARDSAFEVSVCYLDSRICQVVVLFASPIRSGSELQ